MNERMERVEDTRPMEGVVPWPERPRGIETRVLEDSQDNRPTMSLETKQLVPPTGAIVEEVPKRTRAGELETTREHIAELERKNAAEHESILAGLDGHPADERRGYARLEPTPEMTAWMREQESARGMGVVRNDEPASAFERRHEEFGPEAERIRLPEDVERDMLDERPGSMLSRLIGTFRDAGVAEKDIDRYRQAIRAYSENRPAIAVKESHRFDFAPQDFYFGTHIRFNEAVRSFPDLLRSRDLKPRIGREGGITVAEPVSGEEVLRELAEAPREPKEITSMERFLVQANRLMYEYHEALHVVQGLTVGDQFNRLREELGNPGLLNAAKEQEIIEYRHLPVPPLEQPPWVAASALIAPDDADWIRAQVANNESTMDMLAAETLRPYLREQPAFMLWLHNTMGLEMSALRAYRDLLVRRASDEVVDVPSGSALTPLRTALTFLVPAYFAAFGDSDAALAYLEKLPQTKDGHSVSGNALRPDEPFDRAEVLNTLRDVQLLASRSGDMPLPAEYAFPSGARHFIPQDRNEGPVTIAGARNAALIVEAAALRGKTTADVQPVLDAIQDALVPRDPGRLEAVRTQLSGEYGLDFTEDDLAEMYNCSKYTYYGQLGERTYSYCLVVRQEVVERLKGSAPEEVRHLVQNTFFEGSFDLPARPFALASGFLEAKEYSTIRRPWEEILQDRTLGVFDLDVAVLPPEEQDELEALYMRSEEDWSKSQYQDELFRALARMANRQRVE